MAIWECPEYFEGMDTETECDDHLVSAWLESIDIYNTQIELDSEEKYRLGLFSKGAIARVQGILGSYQVS